MNPGRTTQHLRDAATPASVCAPCVPGKFHQHGKSIKFLISLVEPSGIEPLTS